MGQIDPPCRTVTLILLVKWLVEIFESLSGDGCTTTQRWLVERPFSEDAALVILIYIGRRLT